MLNHKELTKLINYLLMENGTMQKDIEKAGDRMPTLKALFEIAIVENNTLIEKLETLRIQQ